MTLHCCGGHTLWHVSAQMAILQLIGPSPPHLSREVAQVSAHPDLLTREESNKSLNLLPCGKIELLPRRECVFTFGFEQLFALFMGHQNPRNSTLEEFEPVDRLERTFEIVVVGLTKLLGRTPSGHERALAQ